MSLTIVEEPPHAATFAAYKSVSIAFQVESRFRLGPFDAEAGGFSLVLEPVTPLYTKDYDTKVGDSPTDWGNRWDTSRWGVLAAYDDFF